MNDEQTDDLSRETPAESEATHFDHTPPGDLIEPPFDDEDIEPEPTGDPGSSQPAEAMTTETTETPAEEPDDDAVEDTGRGPYAQASEMLAALKVALRAAPRKTKDSPAVAFLVIHTDGETDRIGFAARDGRRWHYAFASTSSALSARTVVIDLPSAKKLVKWLDAAAKAAPRMANLRFPSPLQARIFAGENEPIFVDLHEFESGRASDGWRPPSMRGHNPGAAAIADYDAKCIAEATTWPGGGAILKRDEVDDHGRRHFTLTDGSGTELLRAVIVPHGQTDGLPADRQTEIPGTLTPAAKKKEPKKKPRSPKAEAKRVGGPGKKSKPAPIVHRGRKPSKKGGKR